MRTQTYSIRVTAPFAYWGGVVTGPSRTSNDFPSQAAAVGLLRSIIGKWEWDWWVERVWLLAPLRRITVMGNEPKHFTVDPHLLPINPPRTQRVTVYLREVDYLIQAHQVRTLYANPAKDTLKAIEDMTARRLKNGQYFRARPYCGTRECGAETEWVEDPTTLTPINYDQDYGIQYYDTAWHDREPRMWYVPMKVEGGVLVYPTWDQVREFGCSRLVQRREA